MSIANHGEIEDAMVGQGERGLMSLPVHDLELRFSVADSKEYGELGRLFALVEQIKVRSAHRVYKSSRKRDLDDLASHSLKNDKGENQHAR